ncbi:hypothetical protein MVES_000389 [Malassezia vespertilionis]|uniref:ATP-dependent (S)-NAD(P)H-hydrate dehydratase n=1 Tax=Malassezia vespertilionis TaxID=2020962 RepID=A0A2N1JGS7_9BASI|nr:hypothetical protein MVES_000389 [Malassezia vespertilionis]
MCGRTILQHVKAIIPRLKPEYHKGQAGRVGVIGGSRDYTGAPFYASMSSMRLGCDMTLTFCAPEAALPIKSYSPDLIVQPVMDCDMAPEDVRSMFRSLFARLHSLVIGPGLGRDPGMQNLARIAIEVAREENIYVVIDADGLWLLQNAPEVIQGYRRAVLTPNVVEFARLCKSLNIDQTDQDTAAQKLSQALGGATILEKGPVDRIATADELLVSDIQGGLKRCGGQGDLLSGSLGTFLAWAKRYEETRDELPEGERISSERLPALAAFGASSIARTASHLGFTRLGRSMLADDLLGDIGSAYERYSFWG